MTERVYISGCRNNLIKDMAKRLRPLMKNINAVKFCIYCGQAREGIKACEYCGSPLEGK